MSIKTDREVLEDAIFRDFEDYTTHAAYADLLAEEGDPRGEYIRLQLALENTSLPVRERRQLDMDATKLYREHFHDWVGHLDFRVSREPGPTARSANFEIGMRRGWVTSLQIHRVTNRDMLDLLIDARELRMLQGLEIGRLEWTDASTTERLSEAGWTRGLRKFRLDDWDETDDRTADRTAGFLQSCTSLETLSLGSRDRDVDDRGFSFRSASLRHATVRFARWPRVRTLLDAADIGSLQSIDWNSVPSSPLYDPDDWDIAEAESILADRTLPELGPMPRELDDCPWTVELLTALFESPRYRTLKSLRMSFPRVGDILPLALVRSGLIERLEGLWLDGCGITDVGAQMLIDARKHPDLRLIDLRDNPLTPAVVDQFRRLDTIVWAYTSQDRDDEIPF